MRVLLAGGLYFGIIFAIGFVLGTVRTLLVQGPAQVDPLLAVASELPFMLLASWLVAGALIRHLGVGARLRERVAMGGIGFVLLMVGETALGLVLMGQTIETHLALYAEPSHLLGLIGQMGFGILPALVPAGRTSRSPGQD